MKEQEWTYVDRSTWPEHGNADWDNEPDKKQWLDKETGLPCLIVRGPSGALCGYVGVPSTHPCFEKDYGDVCVEVHGGLTFSDRCHPREEFKGICHIVEEGDDDNVWWLGFDCAHYGDITPAYDSMIDWESSYKNFRYVQNEVEFLAKQLAEKA